jgi:8-oxo-dGTP diphosphatase
MGMPANIREFGKTVSGATYRLRPGGYAVIFDSGQVAISSTPAGMFLPGGGQHDDERPEDAALREVAEECGLRITLGAPIGVADEMVVSRDDGVHYRKRCTFFLAQVTGTCEPVDSDHRLIWVSPHDAVSMLLHESARWAVAEGCRLARVDL